MPFVGFIAKFFVIFIIGAPHGYLPRYIIFFQNYMSILTHKGVKGRNETRAARKKNYFGFFFSIQIHSMS